jgi:ribosomal-protein-alanine N-acetyltransferase
MRRKFSERLDFEPFEIRHAASLMALWQSAEVRRYLFDDSLVDADEVYKAISRSQTGFEKHGLGMWVLFPRGQNNLIGFAGFINVIDGAAELMYGLRVDYWRRGLALEAAGAVTAIAFETDGIQAIIANVDRANAASQKLLVALDMTLDAAKSTQDPKCDHYELTRSAWAGVG